jgi:hypothetical protein
MVWVEYAESACCPKSEAKLCCEFPGTSSVLCMDGWRLKLGALRGPLRFLGPGESNLALLIAVIACDAVEEIFLKKVPDKPLVRFSEPALLYMRFR